MLRSCARIVTKTEPGRRPLFEWLNVVFNRVDEERRKEVGSDRVCAEWLLRNGAYVKWNNSPEFLTDYNKLPGEGLRLHIVEVDATEASIMHYGFDHFKGCDYIKKIHFHKCDHLENQALKKLSYLKHSLISLQICECLNISDEGLLHLSVLKHLKELILKDLPYIKNKDGTVAQLQTDLPNCKISFC